jgi:hypothetical protein
MSELKRPPDSEIMEELRAIGLSAKAASYLIADGVNAVSDLSRWRDADLLRIPGMGPGALRKIRARVRAKVR